MSGRAMASPAKNSMLILCFSMSSHTSSGLNSGASTVVRPWNRAMKVAAWVAPWIIGGIGNPMNGAASAPCLARSHSPSMYSPVT
ncbi:Uncharacterised protein [Mycobacteroides abscessus subsp. abscessus]|nr:Uncharacterised protein [Mycobacteroides abscessus subsp. abscessus]